MTNCWNSKPVYRFKDPLRLIIEPPENVVSNAGHVNDLKKIQSAIYNSNRVKVVKKGIMSFRNLMSNRGIIGCIGGLMCISGQHS